MFEARFVLKDVCRRMKPLNPPEEAPFQFLCVRVCERVCVCVSVCVCVYAKRGRKRATPPPRDKRVTLSLGVWLEKASSSHQSGLGEPGAHFQSLRRFSSIRGRSLAFVAVRNVFLWTENCPTERALTLHLWKCVLQSKNSVKSPEIRKEF